MNDTPGPQLLSSTQKPIRVLLAILVAVSFTGYFVGLGQSRRASQQEAVYGKDHAADTELQDVPVVVDYAQQPARMLGPNKNWRSDLTSLRQPAPAPPPKGPASADALAQLLQGRELRRAFDGAPPIIPHPTPPLGVAACPACHDTGAMVGDKRASVMSHPLYSNCTQCHVEVTQPDSKEFWQNTFAALRPATAEAAFPGAPPAVPHPVWMRDNCQSCHGSTGPSALRTTHPERQNCLQCHAISFPQDLLPTTAIGRLDQRTDVLAPAKEKP